MFWRRGGGRFDYGDNSLMAWVVRILVFSLIGIAVILMVRVWTAPREESVAAIFSGGANVIDELGFSGLT